MFLRPAGPAMHTTRVSFIQYLGQGEHRAWEELDRVYRPLIFHWLRRYDLQPSDAEDVAQEVMTVVHRRVGEFDHNGRVGAFRTWLKTVTVNTARNYLGRLRPEATGSSVFLEMLGQLEQPGSEASRMFDRQHDQYVLHGMLERVVAQFELGTIAAFRTHVLEGVDAKVTAERLGVTPRAVYVAKSRVLRALRELAADWINDLTPS